MLDGHSPIAHGNTLDVSENIKNGKIRLDNIAPTLTISASLNSSTNNEFWWFTINNSGGSPFYRPEVLETMKCFSIAAAGKSTLYDDATRKTYTGINSYLNTEGWTPVGSADVSFSLIVTSGGRQKLDQKFGSKFWLKIQGLEDRAGNALWGGHRSDACYILVTYKPSNQSRYNLSLVLPQ